jgi:flavodoxin
MKSLIIYDSNFGNTKRIAESIAAELNGTALPVTGVTWAMVDDVDLLIVGCPIIGWRPTEKILAFLKSAGNLQSKHLKAAAFDTRINVFYSGNAARKISKLLKRAGASIISEPSGFYVKGKEGPIVEGEITRAKNWATELKLIALFKSPAKKAI